MNVSSSCVDTCRCTLLDALSGVYQFPRPSTDLYDTSTPEFVFLSWHFCTSNSTSQGQPGNKRTTSLMKSMPNGGTIVRFMKEPGLNGRKECEYDDGLTEHTQTRM